MVLKLFYRVSMEFIRKYRLPTMFFITFLFIGGFNKRMIFFQYETCSYTNLLFEMKGNWKLTETPICL